WTFRCRDAASAGQERLGLQPTPPRCNDHRAGTRLEQFCRLSCEGCLRSEGFGKRLLRFRLLQGGKAFGRGPFVSPSRRLRSRPRLLPIQGPTTRVTRGQSKQAGWASESPCT